MKQESPLAQPNKASIKEQGDAYCGGEIEKSLRKVAVKQRLRRNSKWRRFLQAGPRRAELSDSPLEWKPHSIHLTAAQSAI
jgi:hypothetical protein